MSEQDNNKNHSLFSPKRLGLIAVFVAIIAVFFTSDVGQYLSYEGLANNEAAMKQAVADAPVLTALIFVGIYITVVTFSLPGALWLSLAGGLMFGTSQGGMLILVGATIGASLLFLVARYLLGDTLQARAGPSLEKFEKNFNRDAVSYLLVLRLLPIFPFFIVNLGAALVGVRFPIFVVTTFFGIIPGTFVFASIGNGVSVLLQQGQQPDVSVITKPEIMLPLVGLALLSLLPVVWRRFGPSAETKNDNA